MNKLLTKIVGLSLGLSMAIGVGVAVATVQGEQAVPVDATNYVEVPSSSLDLTLKTAGCNNYNSTTAYGDWSITYGANNNNGWSFYKMGGKKATLVDDGKNPCYINSTVASSKKIDKFTVAGPSGSLSKSGMAVNSWGLYVYSDSALTAQVDYVAGTVSNITNSAWSQDFVPSTGKTWSAGSYFKVLWDLGNTTTTNGVVCVDKITAYEESSGSIDDVTISGTTSLSSGFLGLTTTQLTATVTQTGGLATTVDWSSDDETVAKVDSNGKVLFLANDTAHITAKSTVDPTVYDTVTVSAANLVAYTGSTDIGDFTDTSIWGTTTISDFSGNLTNIAFADGGSTGNKLAYNKSGNMRVYSGTKMTLSCSPAYAIQYVVAVSESANAFSVAPTSDEGSGSLYGLEWYIDTSASVVQSVTLSYAGTTAYIDTLKVYYVSTGSCGVSIDNPISVATRGDSGTFTATTSGATSPVITWSSSNDDVISIDSSTGEYSVDFVGTTTITATLTCVEGGDSASFDVTVSGLVSITEANTICASLASGAQTSYKVTLSNYINDLNPNSKEAGSENQVTLADYKVGGSGNSFLVHGITGTYKVGGLYFRTIAVLNGALTVTGNLKNYSGTYEMVSPSLNSYTDDAVEYATASYEALNTACETGPSAVTTEQWEALASNYNSNVDEYSKAKLTAADVSGYGTAIINWRDRYERIVNSGKTDFMNLNSSGSKVIFNSVFGDSNNTIAIIAIISVISVSAIGGFFFLRKRKEQ